MSETRVANRYAKALIDFSVEQNNLEVILNDMKFFLKTLKQNHQIESMLKSPVIVGGDKIAILKKIFDKDLHKDTIRFFEIVIRKNRGFYLNVIAKVFIEQYNILNNIMQATVKTAQAIDDKLKEEIKQFIEKYMGKKVELKSIVDPKLIGGLMIQMDDKLFDASISGKLNKLKQDLLNTYISK
ncbi:MAG: ATP synthase F1 subunit delta [Bacteroidota bacterium]